MACLAGVFFDFSINSSTILIVSKNFTTISYQFTDKYRFFLDGLSNSVGDISTTMDISVNNSSVKVKAKDRIFFAI